jgi:hypothetical protein
MTTHFREHEYLSEFELTSYNRGLNNMATLYRLVQWILSSAYTRVLDTIRPTAQLVSGPNGKMLHIPFYYKGQVYEVWLPYSSSKRAKNIDTTILVHYPDKEVIYKHLPGLDVHFTAADASANYVEVIREDEGVGFEGCSKVLL